MPTYEEWNRAIISFFTAGIPEGSPVYLSLDLDAIEGIAGSFLKTQPLCPPIDDFLMAVRQRTVMPAPPHVNLQTVNLDDVATPYGVGFLGLMVFAAYRMHEDERIDESNYFTRLREVLGLPASSGRPAGLPPGAEEPLWQAWNRYLADQGYLTTAERGAGPQTYLRYIVSQTILRDSDKQYLQNLFRDNRLSSHLDCDQLGQWLLQQNIGRKHLQEGLENPDPLRVWEFFQAAHRVYEAGDWSSEALSTEQPERIASRNIECGLYRLERPDREAQYFAFPRQPARVEVNSLLVVPPPGENPVKLKTLRAGFFHPLPWRQEPFLQDALQCEVQGDVRLRKLLCPRRDFWILTRDPETHLGAWATWKRYLELGEHLLVLCRKGPFDAEMLRFRESELLDWTARVECDRWIEFQGCMVISYDWGGFISDPQCKALADALAPHSMAGISLSGGLRDPNQGAWLEGFPPTVKVYGFDRDFVLTLTATDGHCVTRTTAAPQVEIALLDRDLPPGNYLIEAAWSSVGRTRRMMRIVDWARLQHHPQPEEIANSNPISTAGILVRGALVLDDPSPLSGGTHA